MGTFTVRWRWTGWRAAVLAMPMFGLVYVVILYTKLTTVTRAFADFLVFWTAARLPNGQVYDAVAVTNAARWYLNALAPPPFSYPPSALLLFRVFAHLDFLAAAWMWSTLSVVAVVYTVWRWAGLRVALLVLVTPPALYALAAGQTTLVVAALIAGAATQLASRPWIAGATIAAAALVKPQLVVLVPVTLALAGRWTALASAVVTGALAGALCVLIQGSELWWAWVGALSHFMGQAATAEVLSGNITVAGTGLPLAGPVGVGLGLICAWRAARLPSELVLHGAVLASLLSLPYAMPYDLAAVAALAARWLLDEDGPVLGWLAGFALLSAITGVAGLLIAAAYMVWTSMRGDASLLASPASPSPHRPSGG